MKYKLLTLRNKYNINIGDYIQALAASQFYPQINGFVDRENLKNYEGENCKMIMNGWYMHNPQQWPPSEKIKPFFVSLHINSSAATKMLEEEGVKYLKKHEPIGCRDYYTKDLLLNKGIDAYFSGCLTLTLGYKYKSNNHDKVCYFVDPTIDTPKSFKALTKNLLTLIFNANHVLKVSKKIYPKISLFRLIKTAGFFRLYNKIFTKQTISDATYLNHQSSHYAENFSTDYERLEEAKRLVTLYSKAGLVVTSRIHCALPCLGLETPVIFTTNFQNLEISSCRFGGLEELFNVIRCDADSIRTEFQFKSKIDCDNVVSNKNIWRPLAASLIEKCKQFEYSNQKHESNL